MARLDPDEVKVVEEAIAFCAEQQSDQLTGRKFLKSLLDFVKKAQKSGVPVYTILVSLWVTIHTLATEWQDWRKVNGDK